MLLSHLNLRKVFLFVYCASTTATWIMQNGGDGRDKGLLNACILRCHKLDSKLLAGVGPHGCICDDFAYHPGYFYIYRQGGILLQTALIFIPFTSAISNFQSIGAVHTEVSVRGTVTFNEGGPNGHLPGDVKAMRLLGAESHLSYTLPETFVNKARRDGVIFSFWLKLRDMGSVMPIFLFLEHNAPKFTLYTRKNGVIFIRLAAQNGLAKYWKAFQADTKWHHISVIFKSKRNRYEIRMDGKSLGNVLYLNSANIGITKNLRFGKFGSLTADAGLFCFVVQELGNKNSAEITAAINQAKGGCDKLP